jgi:hypothetical protein
MYDFAVGHIHKGELDRNVAVRSEHPFAMGVRSPEHEVAHESEFVPTATMSL